MDVKLQKIDKVAIDKPLTTEEQLAELKLKMDSMSQMFFMLRKMGKNKKKKEDSEKVLPDNPLINKDGIPINTCFIGYTKNSPYPYILVINEKGEYTLGNKIFDTLSAAAEFVSGVKRSGWLFWKTLEGLSVKEVYRP